MRVYFQFLKVYLPSHRNIEVKTTKKVVSFNGRIKICFPLTDVFIPEKNMIQHRVVRGELILNGNYRDIMVLAHKNGLDTNMLGML